jgi:hypothetical protein
MKGVVIDGLLSSMNIITELYNSLTLSVPKSKKLLNIKSCTFVKHLTIMNYVRKGT